MDLEHSVFEAGSGSFISDRVGKRDNPCHGPESPFLNEISLFFFFVLFPSFTGNFQYLRADKGKGNILFRNTRDQVCRYNNFFISIGYINPEGLPFVPAASWSCAHRDRATILQG